MIRICLLAALLSLGISCFGQIITSSCDAPDSLKAYYMDDAISLAIQRMNDNPFGGGYVDSIYIPQAYIDTFLNALIAVYNDTVHTASDSACRVFPIHIHCPTARQFYRSIAVIGDTTHQWMRNLMAGVIPTGYSSLDTFLLQYHFTTVLQSGSAGYSWDSATFNVFIHSDSIYNIGSLLRQKAYFYEAQVSQAPSEGVCQHPYSNDIWYTLGSGYVDLKYIYGYGNCNQGGCVYFWQYNFRIYADCRVEFLGDSLVDYSSIGHTGIAYLTKKSALKISPNPTTGQVIIEGLENSDDVSLTDQLGKVHVLHQRDNEVDIADFSSGLYFIVVKRGDTVLASKIIKL